MCRKWAFLVAAITTIACLGFVPQAFAQSNAAGGNQATISNRPKINAVETNITKFKTERLEFITASAKALNIIAKGLKKDSGDLKTAIEGFNYPNEQDPYLASFADTRKPSTQCLGGCAANQKMRWTGSNWQCLNATLPTCGGGTVFSATTCTCINPCGPTSTIPPRPQVPDSAGTCCVSAQIGTNGLCTVCPTGATWDSSVTPNSCRCTSTNGIVSPTGTCPPAVCVAPQIQDPNNKCCLASQMYNGQCPPECPQGTTVSGNRCQCPAPSNALIYPDEICPSCPAGQLPDNNNQCCNISDLQYGNPGDACTGGGGGLACAADVISNCNLPNHPIQPNQTDVVNGVCDNGSHPSDNNASNMCRAMCRATGANANYTVTSPSCVGGGATTCAANEIEVTCGGQPTCKPQCSMQGQTWDSACSGCECVAPKTVLRVDTDGNGTADTDQCIAGCPSGTELWAGHAQCLPPCGANMVRNGSGQCVCNAGYEMWQGQCIAAAPEIKAGCFVDTTVWDAFMNGSCSGSGATNTDDIFFSVGDKLYNNPNRPGDTAHFSTEFANRFEVQWSGGNCDAGSGGSDNQCVLDDVGNRIHTRTVEVRDKIKNTTQQFTINADKETCHQVPNGGCQP